MRARRTAFTLLEVLIAVALMAALFTVAVQLMVATERIFTRLQAHTSVESSGQVGIGRFQEDLRLAAPSTLTIISPPVSVLYAISFRQQDNGGSASACSFVPVGHFTIYFWDTSSGQGWVRREWSNQAPDAPLLPPDPDPILTNTALTQQELEYVVTHDANATQKLLTPNLSKVAFTPVTWPPTVNYQFPPAVTPANTPLLTTVSIQLTVQFKYSPRPGDSFTENFYTDSPLRNSP